jgi:hypothetical protein
MLSLLDDACRRHLVLKTLASEESAEASADPSASRHVELGIVELDDDHSLARGKIETFYEELGRRIDEVGFFDQFVAFETLLNDHRKRIRRTKALRVPAAKNLAQYLRPINRDLADSYKRLKGERDKIAHGLLPVRPEGKRFIADVLSSMEIERRKRTRRKLAMPGLESFLLGGASMV